MSTHDRNLPASWLTWTDGLATQWQDFLLLVGRVLLGWIFILSGWRKLMDIPAFVATMPRRDLPGFLGYVAPFVEFVGGILLMVGFATRYAALLMLLFVIIATFSSHRYWTYPEAQQANQSSHFWKNVSMMGGTVLLFITGAGRYALDAMLQRR
ncbi:MAG TPA: DoxX family protein [Xanthobacteraceae bacterium]|nr:DoxX family protein [Xanthobacteraceae bacterium]